MTTYTPESIRRLERASISAFIQSCGNVFRGEVLDYGCGRQPYRGIITAAGADYIGYDRQYLPANVSAADVGPEQPFVHDWDVIVMTQVLQYEPEPYDLLAAANDALVERHGALVLTGPTNWAEVEPEDLHRFTLTGIRRLLEQTGFRVERLERRAVLDLGGFELSLGYGAVARA